jgi:hypothetical protein
VEPTKLGHGVTGQDGVNPAGFKTAENKEDRVWYAFASRNPTAIMWPAVRQPHRRVTRDDAVRWTVHSQLVCYYCMLFVMAIVCYQQSSLIRTSPPSRYIFLHTYAAVPRAGNARQGRIVTKSTIGKTTRPLPFQPRNQKHRNRIKQRKRRKHKFNQAASPLSHHQYRASSFNRHWPLYGPPNRP